MKKTLHIKGMHCKSCEILVRHGINEIPGCKTLTVSHRSGKLEVEMHGDNSEEKLTAIEKLIEKNGYTIVDEKTASAQKRTFSWKKALWLIPAIVLVYILSQSNVNSLLPKYDNLSFGIAIVVGLVASISTCLAITGGIIMGYTESVTTKNNVLTQLTFHAGRIGFFIIGGAVLGLLGKSFHSSIRFNGVFSIIVGLVLAYIGLQLLGLLPNITKLGFHLPTRMSSGVLKMKNEKYAALVGAITFFLPCGFTQSMQLLSIQSGSPRQGAMIMGGFALGTLPVLLALGVGSGYIKQKMRFLNPLIAALLFVFGLFTITNGYSLVSISATQTQNGTTSKSVAYKADQYASVPEETVTRGHDGSSFVPGQLTLQKGKSYKINVTPTANGQGCVSAVLVPGNPHAFPIRKGQTFTIEVDGSYAHQIRVVCTSMGMRQGTIKII